MKVESFIWAAFIWATLHMAFVAFVKNGGLELDWVVIWIILDIAIAKIIFSKRRKLKEVRK